MQILLRASNPQRREQWRHLLALCDRAVTTMPTQRPFTGFDVAVIVCRQFEGDDAMLLTELSSEKIAVFVIAPKTEERFITAYGGTWIDGGCVGGKGPFIRLTEFFHEKRRH